LGEPVECDELQAVQWEQLNQENQAMWLKALEEFKEQALAGVVSMGTHDQVGDMEGREGGVRHDPTAC
jgi:hypothetical protein